MTKLRISDDVALPEDAVTRSFVVYGGKGKGKTNFGGVLCEELAKRRERFCVTDPLDVWWGLQHGTKKGDEGGLDVVILGGAHGDIPITPDAGEVVADFVADETVSTIVVMRHADGRMWTNGERVRFMAKFVRALFRRQGEKRVPIMLVIDEAGRFVPQMAGKGDFEVSECIGAIEEAVEWGRNVGLGITLITQRSARMNKSVSELAECMIAFNTVGPRSVGAIVEWFGEHIEKSRQNELVGILRKLPVGRALIVSPEWLAFEGEAQIRMRETFDSSATPKVGGTLRAPARARKPDLSKYRERMAKTIEKADADDPKKLRARIAELEKAQTKPVRHEKELVTRIEHKRVEVPVLKDGQIARVETLVKRVLNLVAEVNNAVDPLIVAISKVSAHSEASSTGNGTSAVAAARSLTRPVDGASVRTGHTPTNGRSSRPQADQPRAHPEAVRTPERAQRISEKTGNPMHLTPSAKRILGALLWRERIARESQTPRRIAAALAGISTASSTSSVEVGRLATWGFVEVLGGGMIRLTDAGRAEADLGTMPSSREELWADLKRRMTPSAQRVFDVLVRIYPQDIDRARLAEEADISPTSSTMSVELGRMANLGAVEVSGRGRVRADPVVFMEGAA